MLFSIAVWGVFVLSVDCVDYLCFPEGTAAWGVDACSLSLPLPLPRSEVPHSSLVTLGQQKKLPAGPLIFNCGVVVAVAEGRRTYIIILLYWRHCWWRSKGDPSVFFIDTIGLGYFTNCYSLAAVKTFVRFASEIFFRHVPELLNDIYKINIITWCCKVTPFLAPASCNTRIRRSL